MLLAVTWFCLLRVVDCLFGVLFSLVLVCVDCVCRFLLGFCLVSGWVVWFDLCLHRLLFWLCLGYCCDILDYMSDFVALHVAIVLMWLYGFAGMYGCWRI